MGFKTIDMILAAAVADDATITGIAYPSGTDQAYFSGTNASVTGKAFVNYNDEYDQADPGIGITYGASTITVTNLSGVTWPVGSNFLLQLGYASALEQSALGTLTATGAEINRAADPGQRTEVVTATNVITADESGKVFFLSAVAGFLSTLPLPQAGIWFEFIVATAPTSNGYTIATASSANIIVLGVNELEVDTSDDGPADLDADLLTFVANLAAKGDYLHIECDGTNWYARGQTNLDGGITSATT